MIGVDTNILLRFLVDDDPDQNRSARNFLSNRDGDAPAYVSAVTLAETVWVLNKRLRYPMAQVIVLLRELIETDGMVLEHAAEVDLLIRSKTVPAADLADYLIAWSGRRVGCTHTLTFDRDAARDVPGMELLA